jgi:predicted alpha/beta superfamily hydrolase
MALALIALAACDIRETARPAAPSVATRRPPAPRDAAVELSDTRQHLLVDEAGERTYPIWVALPASYAEQPRRRYPVVFVTDGLYAFPLVRSIRNLLGQRGRNIEDFILVGLPPQQGLTSKESRSRDYTMSDPRANPANAGSDDYTAPRYGEAARYRDFIEHKVFALVATRYRADMRRKVLAGHSLGGLFGSYVLLTRPRMFSHYVLGSPSLWFDKDRILAIEAEYAAAHRDLPAQVRMYIGQYETRGPSERHFRDADMVGDMQAFERHLEARGYPGLRIDSVVIADEDHLSVFPATISRGLRWALPGHGPYAPG